MIGRRVIGHLGDVHLECPADHDLPPDKGPGSCLNPLGGGEVACGIYVAKRNHELVGVRIVGHGRITAMDGRIDSEVWREQLAAQPDSLAKDAHALPYDEKFMACGRVGDVSRRFPP